MENDNFDINVELPQDYEPGFTVVENELLDIVGLSPEKKIVLLVLRRFVGSVKNVDTGRIEAKKTAAWPSLNNLARKAGISKPTVIKSLDFFEWLLWLERVHTKTENGEKGVNKYILKVPEIKFYLKFLESKGISMSEIEEYFNSLYQNKKYGGDKILNKGCIFLSNSYSKEYVEELIKPYKKKPKKKREIKNNQGI